VDFELTEDQLELRQIVHDIVERECPTSLIRAVVAGTEDAAGLWKQYVDLDWPALTIPESDGGIGFTAVESVIVLAELGYVADPTPFLATTTQYAPLVRECATDGVRSELLGAVARGATGAAAFARDTVSATADGDGWVLSGTARYVVDGDRAEQVAIVASIGDREGGGDRDDVGLFVVPGAEVQASHDVTFDGSLHLADLALDGVRVGADRAFTGAGVADGVARAEHEVLAGISAMTVGASQRILDLVLEHVKERKQFGVPIGSFQAVKHLAVDMLVAIERARALAEFAALTIAEDDPRRAVAASMAKAAAGDCQRLCVKNGIQLFGGLGFTWENDLQIFVRRAKAGELLFGSSTHHRATVARTALATSATAAEEVAR